MLGECASMSSSGVRAALQATTWKAPSPAPGSSDLAWVCEGS